MKRRKKTIRLTVNRPDVECELQKEHLNGAHELGRMFRCANKSLTYSVQLYEKTKKTMKHPNIIKMLKKTHINTK